MNHHPANAEVMHAQLVATLAKLGAPVPEQLAYIDALGSGQLADELALEFDDVAGAVLSKNRLSASQRDAIIRIDELLKAMSGRQHAELWTREAVRNSDGWQAIRDAARTALKELSDWPEGTSD